MKECPRCDRQGLICKVIVDTLTLYVCDECDACWESVDQIQKDNFKNLSDYLEDRAIDHKSITYGEYL